MSEPCKSSLRKTLRAERSSWLGKQTADVHKELCATVANFLVAGGYTSVLGYWPFGAEPDLRALYTTLMTDPSLTFALPTIGSKARGTGLGMSFIATISEEQLAPAPPFGILEPRYSADRVVIPGSKTLILVPALAIDASGFRLGYGGGYYDRYLSAYREATALGTVFSPFYPRWLPTAQHDISVGYVATERAVHRIAPQ